MKHFVQTQLEISEKLFNLMKEDHQTRMQEIILWANTCRSLVHKLEARDAEIQHLRTQLANLQKETQHED